MSAWTIYILPIIRCMNSPTISTKKEESYLHWDEVHRYGNWSIELKNIYDDFPNLKVIFTGSSLLQISKSKADLSRRAVIYEMPGLSFREFLRFENIADFPVISIHDIF